MPRRRCGCWRESNGLSLDDPRLIEVAQLTGADVPVCLASRACVMTGVGETLLPLSLPNMPCVMVNPRVPVATKDVFRALGLRNGELLVGATDIMLQDRRLAGSRRVDRRLGRSARGRSPTISKRRRCASSPSSARCIAALSATNGAWLARMSGSGATCFAIFENTAEAQTRGGENPARSPRLVGACGNAELAMLSYAWAKRDACPRELRCLATVIASSGGHGASAPLPTLRAASNATAPGRTPPPARARSSSARPETAPARRPPSRRSAGRG